MSTQEINTQLQDGSAGLGSGLEDTANHNGRKHLETGGRSLVTSQKTKKQREECWAGPLLFSFYSAWYSNCLDGTLCFQRQSSLLDFL